MVSFLSLHLGTILQETDDNVVTRVIVNQKKCAGRDERGIERDLTAARKLFLWIALLTTPHFTYLLLVVVLASGMVEGLAVPSRAAGLRA